MNSIKKTNINNYYKNKKKINTQIEIYNELGKNDIMYKIVNRLVSRTSTFISLNKYGLTHINLLGCSYNELKYHLENQFQEGMSFENYGEWELDHVYPISKFNLNDIEEIKKCFNYKNIQPLWMFDNRSKSNKILKNTQTVNEVNRA